MINIFQNNNKVKKLKLFCDIDGTVNYHYKRIQKWTLPKWPGDKIDKRAFTRDEIINDEVIPESISGLLKLSKYFEIHFLTARNFPNAYDITKEWLDKNRFYYDSINIVSEPMDKIRLLKKNKSDLFIDDLKRCHHKEREIFYYDVIEKLIQNKIRFEIFSNNWDALVVKYSRWAEFQS